MDKKTITHVAAEAAVLGALTMYLLGRISHLENEIKELRVDLQIVAKRELQTEQNHAQAIRQIGTQNASVQHPVASHVVPPPKVQPVRPAARAQPVQVARPQPAPVRVTAPKQKKVQFSDEAEPDSDEELLEQEFGQAAVEVVESETEESSEEVRVKSKARKHGKAIKIPAAVKKTGGARDMDDIKQKAAEMARRAGPDQ